MATDDRLKLLPAVRRTIRALALGPEHAGMVRLAESLAHTIDEMDDETRERMLGQTAGQLNKVLNDLHARAPHHLTRPRASGSVVDQLRARRATRAQRAG